MRDAVARWKHVELAGAVRSAMEVDAVEWRDARLSVAVPRMVVGRFVGLGV